MLYKDNPEFLRMLLADNGIHNLHNHGFEKVNEATKKDANYGREGSIGYQQSYFVNKTTDEYIEVTYEDDSYGYNSILTSIKFVKPQDKIIERYERTK